jgi:hypothetical protein
MKMSSQGGVSSKEASDNPGLYPVKRQKRDPSNWTGARYQFSSPSLGADKTPPHCHMLVVYPVYYLSSYTLPRNPYGWFISNKPLNITISCELVSNLISSYPRIFRDPKQLHSMLGGNVIQCLLALLCQRGRYFGRPKGFHSCLSVRANTVVFQWPCVRWNFISTDQGQDNVANNNVYWHYRYNIKVVMNAEHCSRISSITLSRLFFSHTYSSPGFWSWRWSRTQYFTLKNFFHQRPFYSIGIFWTQGSFDLISVSSYFYIFN